MSALAGHPGHNITMTPGPFGRAYFECSCGEQQTRASKADAVRVALAHHHRVGGCNCPDDVKALPEHPPVFDRRRDPAVHEGPQMEKRYWLTDMGWAAVGGRTS